MCKRFAVSAEAQLLSRSERSNRLVASGDASMPVCSAVCCGHLVPPQRQVADTGMTVAACPLHGSGKRERVDRLQDLFEGHAHLEAGQVRAEAEVRAVTEGQVRVGLTLQD